MNESSTSIGDLPSAPTGGAGNIVMETSEIAQIPPSVPQQPQGENQMPSQAQQQEVSKLVAGIQQASASGATQLPSRDIPRETTHIVNDQQVQPNFVPPPPPAIPQYIPDETPERLLEMNRARNTQSNSVDMIYDEMHIPLMLAILYFIFQLPITHKYMKSALPFIYKSDSNFSFIGYITVSILYAVSFYAINVVMKRVSTSV